MSRVTLSKTSVSGVNPPNVANEPWFDDACILDMDYFVKTLSGIKSKGVRPDLVGSIIAHYASKWVPELSESRDVTGPETDDPSAFPKSMTSTWKKKKFFVETLVGILPPENDTVPCNFLLRLLRVANMVGVELTYREELEKRVSWLLDQASLKELMIPCFSHTCSTLLDVELVLRLVKRFMGLDEVVKSGAALIKVAKLVDGYLAEIAMDSNLKLEEFIQIAGALPAHARAIDDGLYRAVDTYLKVHPGITKQERRLLCRLIDSRKLSPEACLHASQNERLPVRAVVQVLFSEQNKITRQLDWSGPLSTTRSPNSNGLDLPGRCHSKREVSAQKIEIKRLKEDVLRLQNQINLLQNQLEKVVEKKKGFFRWKRLMLMPGSSSVNDVGKKEFEEVGFGRHTPLSKGKSSQRWRKSLS
ncbi:root phototropism protein 3-like [Amaranthus tricolor]|uniref:root phototropism protein 3-like n=1 Tax=Amaranthus tricolor TaxID=29722 RepID=UPI002584CB9E|nr:root phototropism protein 3-like [Amaranthus tricolor]